MPGLEYKIGADVSGFNAGVKQVESNLNKLGATSTKAFRNISSSANQGAMALNSVGQVARDLPFGFIAIQNNLPIVIDQFGALVASSKGVGGALKTLGAALIGPAGVTLAIGGLISAATGLIQKYGSLQNAVDVLTSSNDALAANKRNLIDINKEANKSAGEELARLQVLNAVATDTTNTIDNRKEAAKELIKVYGEYLPNVKEEALLNNRAAEAINAAKDAIIAKALAAAAEKKLAELGAQLLDIQLKQTQAAEKYGKIAEKNNKLEEDFNKRRIVGQPQLNTQASTTIGLLNLTRQELQGLGEEYENIRGQIDELLKLTAGFAKKAGDAFIPDPKTKKALTIPAKIGPVASIVTDFIKEADEEIVRNFTKENIQVPVTLDINIPGKTLKTFQDFADISLLKLQNQLDRTKQFSEALAAQLTESFSNVFSSIGEGIGNVFAGVSNGFSVAQTVLAGLADILINVGKLAISTGVAILGIKKALQSLNPYVAIGAGVALVALGSAVKSKLSNSVPKFAEGGIVTRPTAGIFGEAGPEAVMPLEKLNSMLGNFGGGNVQVSGSFALRGNDLYASIEQTRRQQGRAF